MLMFIGAFGYIWRATDTRTGEIFALKRVICTSAERVEVAKHELEVMVTVYSKSEKNETLLKLSWVLRRRHRARNFKKNYSYHTYGNVRKRYTLR
jgi:hypothetical protein